MLRGYAARKAKKEEEERLASERWMPLLHLFELELEKAGVSLEGLIHDYDLTSPESDANFQLWWNREEVTERLELVQRGLKGRYLPSPTLHGSHSAGPAEWQTIELLANAEAKSRKTLLAALLLTTLRSSDAGYPYDPSKEAREAMSFVHEQAYKALERQDVDTYTTAKTWFLPERFRLEGSPQTPEEMISYLGSIMGDFLVRWVPVRLVVELERREEV